jgi:hypothetical protein
MVPLVGFGAGITWAVDDLPRDQCSTSDRVALSVCGWIVSAIEIIGFSSGPLGALRAERAARSRAGRGAPWVAVVPSGSGAALVGAF